MVRGEVAAMPWESYDDLDVLERPPARRYPSRHGPGPLRRSMPYRIGRGGLLGAYAGVVTILMVLATIALALYLLFSYGGPALLDKLDKAPGELFSTSTTAP